MKISGVLASAAFTLAAFGAGGVASADEVTLKFSSFVGERNPIFQCGVIPIVDALEANTGTKVVVERYFGGGAFGSAPAQYEQVARGVVDISFGVLAYSKGLFPLADIVGVPFLTTDHVEATRVLNDVILPKYLGDELAGVHVIQLYLNSPSMLHLRKEVGDFTDLNGLRVRSGGAVVAEALDALGAQVVAAPAPQAYELMQKGVIDGTLGIWTQVAAFKLGELTTHHYEVRMGGSVGFTFMNEKAYEGLPDDVKAIIDEFSTTESSIHLAECFSKTDDMAKEAARQRNSVIETVPDDVRGAMREKVKPVIQNHLNSLDQKGLPATEIYETLDRELNGNS